MIHDSASTPDIRSLQRPLPDKNKIDDVYVARNDMTDGLGHIKPRDCDTAVYNNIVR